MGAAIRGPSGLIDLGAEPLTIGRSRNNRLVLNNSQISSKHAEIQPLGGGRYQVIDVGSTNGTAVNGVKLAGGQPQPLNAGDTITLGGSGGVELGFELSVDAPWQGNQPQAAAAPGGFGLGDPAAPPAQPFGGGIGQPPPGPSAFAPAPGGFGPPPGQPGPAAQPFPPPQPAYPGQPGGFPPPGGPQFGPPGGPPPAPGGMFPPPGDPAAFGPPPGAPPAVGFPPPGAGTDPYMAAQPQGPGFPPPGGPQFGPPGGPQFGPPGGPPPAGGFAPPGGPGPAPFGGPGGPPPGQGYPPGGPQFGPQGGPPPGYPPQPGYPPPGGAMPVKKRTGRTILLLSGSILVLVVIIVGIVFGARYVLGKKSASPTPTPTTKPATLSGQMWEAPARLEAEQLLVVVLEGQSAQHSMVIRSVDAAVASLRL